VVKKFLDQYSFINQIVDMVKTSLKSEDGDSLQELKVMAE